MSTLQPASQAGDAADRATEGQVVSMPELTVLPLPEPAGAPPQLAQPGASPLPPPANVRRFPWRAARTRARPSTRPRILMTTEATYPYAVGGVSSWCDLLIDGLTEFQWQILPIMAGGERSVEDLRAAASRLAGGADRTVVRAPATAALVDPRRPPHPREPARQPGARADRLGGQLSGAARGAALVQTQARRRTRRLQGRARLAHVPRRAGGGAGRAPPGRRACSAPGRGRGGEALSDDLLDRARRGTPTPQTDLLHVTAAGWAVIPALVHKELHGTECC